MRHPVDHRRLVPCQVVFDRYRGEQYLPDHLTEGVPPLKKKYIVTLTDDERQHLEGLLSKGKAAARTLRHAQALLKADQPVGWTDADIADAFALSVRTIERLRQRFVEQGLEAALCRKKQDRPSRQPILDGAAEARLIALACSQPPKGRARWTLRLLADQLVELEVVEAVSHETVRQTLKKTRAAKLTGAVAPPIAAGRPADPGGSGGD